MRAGASPSLASRRRPRRPERGRQSRPRGSPGCLAGHEHDPRRPVRREHLAPGALDGPAERPRRGRARAPRSPAIAGRGDPLQLGRRPFAEQEPAPPAARARRPGSAARPGPRRRSTPCRDRPATAAAASGARPVARGRPASRRAAPRCATARPRNPAIGGDQRRRRPPPPSATCSSSALEQRSPGARARPAVHEEADDAALDRGRSAAPTSRAGSPAAAAISPRRSVAAGALPASATSSSRRSLRPAAAGRGTSLRPDRGRRPPARMTGTITTSPGSSASNAGTRAFRTRTHAELAAGRARRRRRDPAGARRNRCPQLAERCHPPVRRSTATRTVTRAADGGRPPLAVRRATRSSSSRPNSRSKSTYRSDRPTMRARRPRQPCPDPAARQVERDRQARRAARRRPATRSPAPGPASR